MRMRRPKPSPVIYRRFTKLRFPRLKNTDRSDDFLLLAHLRERYPLKVSSGQVICERFERLLAWLVTLKTDRLREACFNCGLSDEGNRTDLLRRLYLHNRSRPEKDIDNSMPCYGSGYEMVRPPTCVWGKLWLSMIKEANMNRKRFPRRAVRFSRTKRFVRLIRCPRLGKTKEQERAESYFETHIRCKDLIRDIA
jgi:hypothetical protein